MIGAGAALGSMLLVSSVYAGIGTAAGYDTYKSAIKNTAAVANVTEKVSMSVVDNGKVLLQVNSTVKSNKVTDTDSADITLQSGTTAQNLKVYNQNDTHIMKSGSSNVYKVFEMDQEHRDMMNKHRDQMEKHDPAMAEQVENVIDALMGNLKNKVTLANNGASKEVALNLTGSQIPAVVNAVGSVLVKEGARDHAEEFDAHGADSIVIDVETIKDSLPKLSDDIKIESVKLNAKVNADNRITNQAAEIAISGKDASGAAHKVVVKLNADLSAFNSTTPDTVDLTGKQVEKLSPSKHEWRSIV
ncbi:hypothetical protein SD71_03740 [Cohnella kolymensis]|uniref:Uncharacterized protein n=1 Tax=Cohnella kolymensis TaxID=1590652 RepID=A0ABR5A7T2_9BACL|nr:hypothetical protein [Cohnella kolymensis]KIL37089.1 hypothetical protein SD71_03740 [Cohnella kolymensis]